MLEVSHVTKHYPTPRGSLAILSDVSLTLSRGEAASIMGPSGSGKSTLLYILGALEPPSSGSVTLDGKNPFHFQERELAAFRNKQVGFVFQDHLLLPQCTVLENVLMPTLVGDAVQGSVEWATALLDQVGLKERLDHRPGELSGGEKQRVAIARALVHDPLILLADEPTGNLDPDLALDIMDIIADAHARGTTVLVATHDPGLLDRYRHRRLVLEKGCLLADTYPDTQPGRVRWAASTLR